MEALRATFRPEFLNRIDEVIVFHSLDDAELGRIVDLLLADLAARLAEHDLTLELTPAARALVAREGNDPQYGARPLKRAIQRLIENPLARALLEGRFPPGSTITVDADPVGGTLLFSSGGETGRDRRRVATGRPRHRRGGRSRPASGTHRPPADGARRAGPQGAPELSLGPVATPDR